MRLAILLGKRFSDWLLGRWTDIWNRHAQPPNFFWTFKEMVNRSASADSVLIASRFSLNTKFSINGIENQTVKDLLDKPGKAAAQLSKACMLVFEGNTNMRTVARNLDFLVYGREVSSKIPELGELIIQDIGDQKPRDVEDTNEEEK